MLAAITLGPHRPLLDWINEMCAEVPGLCVYKTLHSYPNPHELFQLLNIFTPEVVFLDLESSDTALSLVKEIRACYPKTAVIGFVKNREPDRLRRIIDAGVAEVLPAPCPAEEVQQAVVRAVEAHRAEAVDNIVAFLPAKAGSGSTTAVLHVAAALAQDWRQTVLLLEADWQSGSLAHLLGLDPQHSTLDALENSQWMKDEMWSRHVLTTLGVQLLAMPTAKRTSTLSRWEYQRLLTFASPRYDTVLVDLPEVIDDAAEGVVAQAKAVYIVCTPDKPSLFLARRRVDELKSRGAADSRLHIVLNRQWDKEQDLQETERFLERRLAVVLPNDDSFWRRPLPDALLAGEQSDLGRSFRSFARMLAGGAPPPPPPPAEQRTSRWSLFRTRAPADHPEQKRTRL